MSIFAEIFHGERVLEIRMQTNEKNTFDLNAFSTFGGLLKKHAQNENLRAVLLTSAQTQFFSNGIEPSLMYGKSDAEIKEAVTILIGTVSDYFLFPVPTISIINGHCMAAGAVFALFSDYRYMVDKGARIGFSEAIVGLNFPSVPTMVLKDLVGYKNARDLLYTGKQIKSPEAKEIGLVDELYPAESLFNEGLKFANSLAKLTYNSSRGMKTALRDFYHPILSKVFEQDIQHFARTIQTKDGQEGFLSLLEKRRPNFIT
ncbi:enoyl-CoA hydratase/isomerase family protein [Leptospira ilyithenensis]|uniref:Enoyl-CoA hydratase/isomerase family protein n=1 Tax=Leptospira ilyithenensis TaxID=2484901 RepID=A0A4R9LM04_9LEPT|nr:enoyl-CoA hydratase/isomerase family protein [Leptospira ilyithenensis]TGN08717.1 enoyl-CoA hydratase/isomerase family protein [Leptospira ilyithenensis]